MTADTQIKSIFERWERLEGEKKAISDDLKELFAEAKLSGYDGKALRAAFNLKVKQEAATPADEQFDLVVETYLDALNGSPRDARLRTRENIEEFDPETGEFRENGYANAKLVETVASAMQTEIGRKALGAAVDILIAREEAEEDLNDDAESVGSEVVAGPSTLTAGKTATNPEMDRATEGSFETGSEAAENARKAVPETEDGSVTHAGAGESPATEIAPASQGEAEAPSVDSEETGIDAEDTRSDANTGGRHVTAHPSAAPHQAGALVKPAPATPGQIVFEHTPPVPMHRFAFAHCWPELTKAEYEALEAEISNDPCSVIEPIVRKGDVILDGWARYNIARSFGDEYPVVEYDGEDELLDVIRWQRAARRWSPEQERKIASALAKEVPHRASEIMDVFEIEGEVA